MANSPSPHFVIGFAGIGLMGSPMAARLIAAGYRVLVWNRSSGKCDAVVQSGAERAAVLADLARADVIITMLSDGPAVSQVLDQLRPALRPGTTVVDMSSIPPDTARSHAAALAGIGVGHLDAPVSGGTRGAQDGSLAILAGGSAEDFALVEPVLRALGRPTLIGPSGAGQIAKLANQIIVAITIDAVAEALLFAGAGGADPARVREGLSGGFADSTILQQHGARMLEGNWAPGGALRTQVKDMRTILAEAAKLGLVLPGVERVSSLFEDALAAGLADHDHSALFLQLLHANRLEPPAV